MLDVDFRPDQWADARAFGTTIRSVLPHVGIVIGTEDEINAAMLRDPAQISLTHSQVSDARVGGDVQSAVRGLLALGPSSRGGYWELTAVPELRVQCAEVGRRLAGELAEEAPEPVA